MSQRTRDSKVFENPDGTFTAVIGHYLHYESSPGQWQDVDLNLRPDGSDYVMDRHDIIVRVGNNEVQATNRKTGKGIGFPIPSSPSVTGRRATFTAAGVSWSYYTTKTGLKLSATISARIGQRTYSFPYRVLGSAGSLSVDAAGRLVGDGFVIPRPIIYGADRELYDGGSWRIQAGQIKFDYDDSSLPAAAFPYELDPTTTFTMTTGSDDGQVYRQGTSYPPGGTTGVNDSATTFLISRKKYSGTNYQISNALFRFDTSTLPDLASISDAKLRMYVNTVADGDNRVMTADYYFDWPIDDADYIATPQGGASPVAGWDIGLVSLNATNAFSLINLNNISKTGNTGLRLHINDGGPGWVPAAMNQVGGTTLESTDFHEPQLVLTYTDPAPTLTSASHSPVTGAPGVPGTFSVGWTDPGDQVKAVICKTNSISAGSCLGGAWAVGSLSSASPSTASYTPISSDHGTQGYYAFACDAANSCSSGDWGFFKVDTAPATPASLAPADGSIMASLVPTLSASYSDPDGDSGVVEFEVHRTSDNTQVTSGTGSGAASGGTSSWTVPAGVLSDGVDYFWIARARGNFPFDTYSGWTANIAYRPDLSGPTGPLTSPANESSISGIVALVATPTDGAGSGVARVDFYVKSLGRESLVASDTNASGGWTGSFDSRTVSDGGAIIYAKYTDVVGNVSCCAAGSGAAVDIDNSAPAPDRWTATSSADGVALGDSDAQVILGTGQLVVGTPDSLISGHGFDATFDRGYNSGSTTNGILGPGWRASIEDVVIPSHDGTVLHIDGAGREHWFSPQPLSQVGASYYNGTTLSGPPETQSEDQIAFDWGTGAPATGINADAWSARWKGYLNIPASGTWTFSATTDDGVRLLIDGVYVIDNWKSQTATEVSGSMTLATGAHEITMEYFDNTGPASAFLRWQGPGTSYNVIPSSAFSRAFNYSSPAGVYDTLYRFNAGDFKLTSKYGIERHYGIDGKRDRITDRNGNVLSTAYDANGRPEFLCVGETACNEAASEIALTYDANGRIDSVSDVFPRTWYFTYDAGGRLESVEDPEADVTTYGYDAGGRLSSVQDPELDEGRATYDGSGKVSAIRDPGSVAESGPSTTYTYGSLSATERSPVANSTNPLGAPTSYVLGTAGQLLSRTDPLGKTLSFEYDANFNLTKTIDELNKEWIRIYDTKGNLTQDKDPLQHATTYTYWPDNNVKTETDPNNKTTEYAYDGSGNLSSVTDPAGVTTFGYNSLGEKTSETEPRGNVDGANAEQYTAHFTYDARGNLETVTDAEDNVTTYESDAAGDKLTEDDPMNPPAVSTYDALGRVLSETDPEGGKTTYTYDGAGRELTSVTPVGNSPGKTPTDYDTLTTYYPDGAVKDVTDPAGGVTRYEYDWNGNTKKEIDPRNNVTESFYDLAGRLTEVHHPGGGITNYEYDDTGRTLKVIGPAVVNGQRGETVYDYDDAGRLESLLDPSLNLTTYTYDPAGNLKTTTSPKGNLPDAVEGSYTTTNDYDNAGRLWKTTDPIGGVTQHGYDVAGNETSITDPSGAVTSFTYDTLGRESQRLTPSSTSQSAASSVDAFGTTTSDTAITPTGNGAINAALSWQPSPPLTTQSQSGSLSPGPPRSYSVSAQGEALIEPSLTWSQGETMALPADLTDDITGGASPIDDPAVVSSTHAPITASLDWDPYIKTMAQQSGSVAALGSDSSKTVNAEGPGYIKLKLTWQNSTSSALNSQTQLYMFLYAPTDTQMATPVAQKTTGAQNDEMPYYVPSNGPFGLYKIKVVSTNLAANYQINGSAPVYAALKLEIVKPNNQIAASTTSRGVTISHTPLSGATGQYKFRVSITSAAPSKTDRFVLHRTFPILAYPSVTMTLFNPGGTQVMTTGSVASGSSSLAYPATSPGGAYRVDIKNDSSFSTNNFTLTIRSTSVNPVNFTGTLSGSTPGQHTVTSEGSGTLEADIDWEQGQTTASPTFSGSMASGAAPFDHPVEVSSTHAPITASLSWATYAKPFWPEDGGLAPLAREIESIQAEGPGTISISVTWENGTSPTLTDQTHLHVFLYNGFPLDASTLVAQDIDGGRPATINYAVPAGGPFGTYYVEIESADLQASYTMSGSAPAYADLNLELLPNPSGPAIDSDTGSGRPAEVSASPPTTGQYKFRVSIVAGTGSTSSYTLTTSYPIMAYATVVAKLYQGTTWKKETSGRPGTMYFQGAVASDYRVEVVNTTPSIPVPQYTLVVRPPAKRNADLDLQLLDSSNTVIAEAPNHAANPETLTFPNAQANTTYKLRAIARQYAASFTLDYGLPATLAESKVYDAAGRLWKTIDPSGPTTMDYDNANRLELITLPGGATRRFTYDADGQTKTITDATGTQSFTYDTAARLDTATDQAQVLTDYGYDAAGNQDTLTRPGSSVTSGFDAENRLNSRSTGPTASFGYGDLVNRTQVVAGSGEADTGERNTSGEISGLEFAASTTAAPRTDIGFLYDEDGNRETRTSYAEGGQSTQLASFGYDEAGRLSTETYRVAGVQKTVTYAFDAQGNRTQMTTAAGQTTYTANPAGQLTARTEPAGASTAYLYDSSGNLAKQVAAAGTTTFTWTPDDRLANVTAPGQPAVAFTYDANGARRTKTVGSTTTTYAWEQGHLVSEQTGAAVTRYTYDDAGAPLTITLPSGAAYTYHYDEAGSVAELTDATKATAASYVYDAWGNVVERSGVQALLDVNAVLYRGAFGIRFDKETGLYLMGARYYDPVVSRFISRDPANANSSESSYAYAGNNPVAQLDSTGLAVEGGGGNNVYPPQPDDDDYCSTGRNCRSASGRHPAVRIFPVRGSDVSKSVIERGSFLRPGYHKNGKFIAYSRRCGHKTCHGGTDLSVKSGDRLYATCDGKLKIHNWHGGAAGGWRGFGDAYGNHVLILCKNGWGILYAHLKSFEKGTLSNARVGVGTFLGRVGSTGAGTGPHLHFELHKEADGSHKEWETRFVDPYQALVSAYGK